MGVHSRFVNTIPALVGLENPKPWDATLPPPELKVPVGFCSPKVEVPYPKVLAPLFPNKLEVSGEMKNTCEDLSTPHVKASLLSISQHITNVLFKSASYWRRPSLSCSNRAGFNRMLVASLLSYFSVTINLEQLLLYPFWRRQCMICFATFSTAVIRSQAFKLEIMVTVKWPFLTQAY